MTIIDPEQLGTSKHTMNAQVEMKEAPMLPTAEFACPRVGWETRSEPNNNVNVGERCGRSH